MTASINERRREALLRAFQMPSIQTMVSRKSSITNAFVNAIIPTIQPSAEEIAIALDILGMAPPEIRCAYCGDPSTEWDHLRPLVLNRRPTGYISEIANLVPACGKCNQSKGNKEWPTWITSSAPRSPKTREVADLQDKIERLKQFERRFIPRKLQFARLVGEADWEKYWKLCDDVNDELRRCQEFAESFRERISRAAQ